MSAQEVIEQIKALPPEEQVKVQEFVHVLEKAAGSRDASAWSDDAAFQAAKRRVFERHGELLAKLAK